MFKIMLIYLEKDIIIDVFKLQCVFTSSAIG
jgi:hypothetical protein